MVVTINGKSYDVDVDNKITIAGGLEAGDYVINAILKGNENYTGSDDTKSFKVVKYNIEIVLGDIVDPIVVDSPLMLTANLNESVTGDVVFTINGANYTVSVSDTNVATYSYTPINNATISVVAIFMGNDKYNSAVSAPGYFNVNRIVTNLSVSIDEPSIFVGDDVVVTVSLNPAISGVVSLSVGSSSYDVAVVDGVGTFIVSNLANGTYDIEAVFAGDVKYADATSNNVTLAVNKIKTIFTAGDVVATYNIDETLVITLKILTVMQLEMLMLMLI